jgi:DNA topoisomerase-2
LGTSTSAEGKVYFSNLDKHVKSFAYGIGTENAISLAFSKDRVQDRKTWLQESYNEDDFIDPNKSIVTFEEFINVEMIQFSYADLVRSLPSVIDGLKPSQRKVLHSCFKRNLNQELKVVQLGGSVAEISGYHHGDQSLTATIVRMAQDYTGSNNVPLLFPSGQFGTRHEGGKDFASPRYIFTRLSKMTRFLFPQVSARSLICMCTSELML